MTIKAIETRYAGCRFRSRLEARWAVFFDSLNIEWQYEPQGFETPYGPYLPDFWLPIQKYWIEIKGTAPTKDEQDKLTYVSMQTLCESFIFFGDIIAPDLSYNISESAYKIGYFIESQSEGWDNEYCWCECPKCGYLGITYNGRAARLKCKCRFPEIIELEPRHGEVGYFGASGRGCNCDHCMEVFRNGILSGHIKHIITYSDKEYNYRSPKLINAYNKARSARFEHGESG